MRPCHGARRTRHKAYSDTATHTHTTHDVLARSVRIPGRLCRILLPLVSRGGAPKNPEATDESEQTKTTDPDRINQSNATWIPNHIKRVRPVDGDPSLKDVLLGRMPGTDGTSLLPPPTATTTTTTTTTSRNETGVSSLPAPLDAVMRAFVDLANAEEPSLPEQQRQFAYALHAVPVMPPDDVATRDAWSRAYWPVSLKMPDKQGRKEYAALPADEVAMMKRAMGRVWDMAASTSTSTPTSRHAGAWACVIVDPSRDVVVGSGVDTTGEHPLGHAVMNAIDGVAAWQIDTWYPEKRDRVHRKGGEQGRLGKRAGDEGVGDPPTDVSPRADHGLPPAPYLCTGYDCYTLNEPCAMCAMALVHSRLRRMVYVNESPGGRGMLGSGEEAFPRLHSRRTLNHHFVVYKMMMVKR